MTEVANEREQRKQMIEAQRTPAGGWTKAQLAEWGVPWPPPRGWKRALIEGQAVPAIVSRFYRDVIGFEAAVVAVRQYEPPFDWSHTQARPHETGESVHGRVEALAFSFAWGVPMLKISGRWLQAQHKALRMEILRLRPEVGDKITITCLGKKGNSYEYEVSVGTGARRGTAA